MNRPLFCPFCWRRHNKKFLLKSEEGLLNISCPVCCAKKVVEKDKNGKPRGYIKDPNSVEKILLEECF